MKYLNLTIEFSTKSKEKDEVTIKLTSKEIRLVINANLKKHQFYNLCVESEQQFIDIITDREIKVLEHNFSDQPIVSRKCQEKMQNGICEEGVYFQLAKTSEKPTKLIVGFPAMAGVGSTTNSFLPIERIFDQSNALYISFLDNYFTKGSCLLLDETGKSLESRVCKIINRYIEMYNVKSDSIYFVGSSKGGLMAAYYSQFYDHINVLIADPLANPVEFFRKNSFPEVVLLDEQTKFLSKIDFPQMYRVAFKISKIHLFYSTIDSSFDISKLGKLPDNIKTYPIEAEHDQVLKESIETINQKIFML